MALRRGLFSHVSSLSKHFKSCFSDSLNRSYVLVINDQIRSYHQSFVVCNNDVNDLFKGEPDPDNDTDFEEEKYIQTLDFDHPVPDSKKKPDSFFNDMVNIDRLKKGIELYEFGMILLQRDNINESITAFQDCISLLEQYVYHKYDNTTEKMLRSQIAEHLIDPYCHLAFAFQKASRYKCAKVYYIKALKLLRDDYTKAEQLAHVAMNLCEVYNMVGRTELAARIAVIHLPVCEATFDKIQYAGSLCNASVYHADIKEWDRAIGYGLEALDIFTIEQGKTHPHTSKFLNMFSKMLVMANEKDVYNRIYDEFYGYIEMKTFEDVKYELDNPGKNETDEYEEKAALDKQAAELLPQIEKMENAFKSNKSKTFTQSVAQATVMPQFKE